MGIAVGLLNGSEEGPFGPARFGSEQQAVRAT
jgi:hypothetical protein